MMVDFFLRASGLATPKFTLRDVFAIGFLVLARLGILVLPAF